MPPISLREIPTNHTVTPGTRVKKAVQAKYSKIPHEEGVDAALCYANLDFYISKLS